MPWNNQGGGWQGGGGQGPWGGRPGGGQQPPDLEELLRRSQEKVKKIFPGGVGGGLGGNRRALVAVPLILVAVWLASGFYRVQPDEQGVVLRFGEWIKTTQPGLNWHVPAPVETVFTPKVTRSNRVEIGFRSAADVTRTVSAREVANESLMLTGDENIVDISFQGVWNVRDPAQFLFNLSDPQSTIQAVAESAMRGVVSRSELSPILNRDRGIISQEVQELIQATLDEHGSGVNIVRVNFDKADPPQEVIDAFREVQAARQERSTLQNRADAYANQTLAAARGTAAQRLQEAEGYRAQVVNAAEGEASRFTAVEQEYVKAPEVTRKRLYLETMESVLGNVRMFLMDTASGAAQNIVPYLPLNELKRAPEPAPTGGSN
jgi:membrane protease subunit HflK